MVPEALVGELLELMRVFRWFTHPVRRGEITAEQYWLLRLLEKAGPLRVGQLAAALGIGQSSVTTACKRLERQGLVRRARDTADERVVRVILTEQGQQCVASWAALRHATAARILSTLSPEEQTRLQELLARVLDQAQRLAREPEVPAASGPLG
ncbi:putative Transcriptional regulator SlyA [Candidatus Hydrogenisulfobacillus filiaventi]|uniref:Putative Transcriptional regulator SlyA n=1 Tax=Candidatus Hydrogenisulfobacillus filiaventi TaxID=2707344 RepID=A0A6F8ZDG7_9FIRM|nr:MarR family transcriptional regulator [Bacillota bacterium]CAB1128056.1 putative Transcriptional regulator SlyA [Candidatus Hydrogenisulfobacillus filiaventi]